MVSEIIKFYKENFVNPEQVASILEYINRLGKEKYLPLYRKDSLSMTGLLTTSKD
jgi:hypothetical protein